MTAPDVDRATRDELAGLVREISVVFGRVTLSSGKEADYYVDLRRATLHLKRRRAVTLAQEVLVATRRGWQADEGESECAHASRRPARRGARALRREVRITAHEER